MEIKEAKDNLKYVLDQLEAETSSSDLAVLKDRISNIIDVFKVENNYIYVIVTNALSKLLIEKFSSFRMDSILQDKVSEKIGFKFITKEDADKEASEPVLNFSEVKHNNFDRSNRKLRAEFTFDNFVVGESNRFAFISAMKVAESPYSVLNPLYIFGDVGLGKTHLMMAIGHYILDKDINKNVVYTSAQQFVEDYFVYTKKDTKNIEFFYDKYRKADILLIDDIQFFENKPGTQEEFFKVFDYLHENNKQIVVTSDRPSNELKIMSRLKSRFSWGLPVDIKTPDETLRFNILKRKLEFMLSNPNDVPDECLKIISNLFSSNVRELEGALRRFVTYCVSMNYPFNEESVYSALDSIIPNKKNNIQNDIDIKIDKLIKISCGYFHISAEDLLSTSRKPNLVYARNICYYIAKIELNLTLSKIGEYFNKKDHTSISYGIEKIKEQLSNSSNVKNDISYVKDKLFV